MVKERKRGARWRYQGNEILKSAICKKSDKRDVPVLARKGRKVHPPSGMLSTHAQKAEKTFSTVIVAFRLVKRTNKKEC